MKTLSKKLSEMFALLWSLKCLSWIRAAKEKEKVIQWTAFDSSGQSILTFSPGVSMYKAFCQTHAVLVASVDVENLKDIKGMRQVEGCASPRMSTKRVEQVKLGDQVGIKVGDPWLFKGRVVGIERIDAFHFFHIELSSGIVVGVLGERCQIN